jgi:hypothetical protein
LPRWLCILVTLSVDLVHLVDRRCDRRLDSRSSSPMATEDPKASQ